MSALVSLLLVLLCAAPAAAQIITQTGGSGGGTGTVTEIDCSADLTGCPITTTGTLGLSNTGPGASSCGDTTHSCSVTIDIKGRITALSNNAIGGGTVTHSLGALTLNAIILGNGGGDVAALGSLGSTTTLLHGNAAGAPTFGAVVSADLNLTTTTCTNQFVTALSSAAAGTCTTDTLASAQHANQGSTTTVLHGNAAGNPAFGAVVSADLNLTSTTCTNQFLTALSSAAAGTCTTATLAGAQFANQGTTTTVLHGNGAGNPAFGSVVAGDIAANAVANAALAVVQTRRVCSMVVGADNGGLIVDADLGPQRKQCQVPYAATIVEIDVAADAGTPNVIVGVRHCTASACTTGANETVSNLVTAALAAGPGTGCAKTGATAGLDTFTTCVATLQNTTVAVGDFIELVSGTAGGTAKRMSIDVHYTVN